MTTLAERVAYLIDVSHSGSVNAAARDIGVPQRTLARIADGSVTSPRADALLRLASFYGGDVEWLLEGRGRSYQASTMTDRLFACVEDEERTRSARRKEEIARRLRLRGLAE